MLKTFPTVNANSVPDPLPIHRFNGLKLPAVGHIAICRWAPEWRPYCYLLMGSRRAAILLPVDGLQNGVPITTC